MTPTRFHPGLKAVCSSEPCPFSARLKEREPDARKASFGLHSCWACLAQRLSVQIVLYRHPGEACA